MKKTLLIFIIFVLAVLYLPLPSPRKKTPEFDVKTLKFPEEFYWGASTSAHQVEGGNHNSFSMWEIKNAGRLAREAEGKFKDIVPDWNAIKAEAQAPANYVSGDAVDHYHRYEEDIQIMKSLGLTAYRFSLEWSRLEPEKDKFDSRELEHYREVIRSLHAAGIEPFVTLWHRTSPLWVAGQGEWENPETVKDYLKYVDYVTSNLGSDVKYWMTFNEPILHILSGYIEGNLPPEIKSYKRGQVTLANMTRAHQQAYDLIRQKDSQDQVGSTLAVVLAEGYPNTLINYLVAKYIERRANHDFLNDTISKTDFIGLQYYSPGYFAVKFGGKYLFHIEQVNKAKSSDITDMGWDIYPAGIYETIKKIYSRYRKPILITENGIPDREDKKRAEFIKNHLYWVHQAIAEGIPVGGYFYWSLLDDFEWDKGFWPKFGLIGVDRKTQKRTIRGSARYYGEMIKMRQ